MKEDDVFAKAELASKSEECQRVNTQKLRLEALEQLWKEGLASMVGAIREQAHATLATDKVIHYRMWHHSSLS